MNDGQKEGEGSGRGNNYFPRVCLYTWRLQMVLNSVIESPELGHIYMYMFLNYVPVGREGVNQEQGSNNSWATLQHYLVKSRWQSHQ